MKAKKTEKARREAGVEGKPVSVSRSEMTEIVLPAQTNPLGKLLGGQVMHLVDMAAAMGVEVLTEEEYFELQKLGEFDTKRSSWIATPPEIRKLGGALYCDRRYGRVFVGHNGADSYYSGRGFRGSLKIYSPVSASICSRSVAPLSKRQKSFLLVCMCLPSVNLRLVADL